jgi:hypothetical protein
MSIPPTDGDGTWDRMTRMPHGLLTDDRTIRIIYQENFFQNSQEIKGFPTVIPVLGIAPPGLIDTAAPPQRHLFGDKQSLFYRNQRAGDLIYERDEHNFFIRDMVRN